MKKKINKVIIISIVILTLVLIFLGIFFYLSSKQQIINFSNDTNQVYCYSPQENKVNGLATDPGWIRDDPTCFESYCTCCIHYCGGLTGAYHNPKWCHYHNYFITLPSYENLTCPGNSKCNKCPGSQQCYVSSTNQIGTGLGNCKCSANDCTPGNVNLIDNLNYQICQLNSSGCPIWINQKCPDNYKTNQLTTSINDTCKIIPPIMSLTCINKNNCNYEYSQDFNGIELNTNIRSTSLTNVKITACPMDRDCTYQPIITSLNSDGNLILDCTNSNINCINYKPNYLSDWNITAYLPDYDSSINLIIHVKPNLDSNITCGNIYTNKISNCYLKVVDRDNPSIEYGSSDISEIISIQLNNKNLPFVLSNNKIEFLPTNDGNITINTKITRNGYNDGFTKSFNFNSIKSPLKEKIRDILDLIWFYIKINVILFISIGIIVGILIGLILFKIFNRKKKR